MTGIEAIAMWHDACMASVSDAGAALLTGNREPIAVALSRHHEATVELQEAINSPRCDWSGVVKVTPKGETEAAFYLCVE